MKKFTSIDPTQGDCSLVTILYADGEVVYTKGGDCWGMRSNHMIKAPVYSYEKLNRELLELFPSESNGYKCVFMRAKEDTPEYAIEKKLIAEYRAYVLEVCDEED